MVPIMRKLYLSTILDLCGRRIVSYVIRDTNDAALVYSTLDQALEVNPGAHPLFHSDRGSAYTTQIFHDKLAAAGITQSISQIGRCIDNDPMEGFGASSSGNDTMGIVLPAERSWFI